MSSNLRLRPKLPHMALISLVSSRQVVHVSEDCREVKVYVVSFLS